MSDCLICNDMKRKSQDSTSDLTYRGHSQDNLRGLTSSTNPHDISHMALHIMAAGQEVLRLYRQMLRVGKSFTSYNYRYV